MSVEKDDYTEHDWYAEAKGRESNGELEEAVEAYRKSIEINPDYAKSWYYMSMVLEKLGKKEEAIKAAKKALELKPGWKKHVEEFLPEAVE
ncbi:MAG: hypothetical protein BAJATHORv1_30462 [Candidatus Thorarchaeota archaeon]|nr:MAG: hypothetical protein BAJATHORv1_30462 [Candidatus Thorarchaeota archaeon]